MWLGKWEPMMVVMVAFFSEVVVLALMEALGKRRGTVRSHRDPALAKIGLLFKSSFVLITLMILAVMLISAGAPPDVPAAASPLLPEQVEQWMRDEHAAVMHLQDVLGALLLYLALQLWQSLAWIFRALGPVLLPSAASVTQP